MACEVGWEACDRGMPTSPKVDLVGLGQSVPRLTCEMSRAAWPQTKDCDRPANDIPPSYQEPGPFPWDRVPESQVPGS